MSFVTGTNMELIYANTAAGTAKASFTAEAQINDTTGMGVQAHLPPDFFPCTAGAVGRGIQIVARGIFGSNATPTYTFTIRCGTAGNTSCAILLGSAALTTGSGVSSQPFEIIGDIFVTTMGAASTNTTVRGIGTIKSPGLATTTAAMWGGAASPGTVATFDTSITNYINFNVTCSASDAANTITLMQLLIFGLN